jgi:TRAP-type uncharacterized transport system substrate-binding protein
VDTGELQAAEDTVYKITKALASNVENLGNVVSAVKGMSVKDMAADVGVPYHPGAEVYQKQSAFISRAAAPPCAATDD